jgi:hypothetical protein
MKQIGIGVHNFHDTHQGLPPIAVYSFKPTIFSLLYPFIEQTPLYDLLSQSPQFQSPTIVMADDSNYSNCWFENLSDERKREVGSVPIYKCPSRRSGVAYVVNDSAGAGTCSGPQSDYAAIVTKSLQNRWLCYMYDDKVSPDSYLEKFRSPFRIPIVKTVIGTTLSTGNDKWGDLLKVLTWEIRDTTARWSDGTSNQLIFGEKYIPTFALNLNFSANEKQRYWDGSYLYAENDRGFNVGRIIHRDSSYEPARILVASPNDSFFEDKKPTDCYGRGSFGSNHVGICQFVFGDGAVHAVSVIISPDILYAVADVEDGEVVQLP